MLNSKHKVVSIDVYHIPDGVFNKKNSSSTKPTYLYNKHRTMTITALPKGSYLY